MYKTLYRKYRPRCFENVVGQDVIVKTLSNSIKNGKINHAYMFFGPRGVGKTSIAKIFARTVNCINNDGSICNECINCKISDSKECLDIIEIDAASNNGVDEIRDLREKINIVPGQLKYRVYIVDEVHMLTIQAFNALLKTLEEPPAHVIFILATTDPQKVPETIISRCQCFSFNRISDNCIVEYLRYICKEENIVVDDNVLFKIAQLSNGGMRDSIGMLDKLYSYCGSNISLDDFFKIIRIVSDDDIAVFVNNVKNYEMNNIIASIDEWNNNGINLVQLCELILCYLKDRLIECIKNGEDCSFFIELSNLINEKMFDLKRSGNVKIYLEIMLLNFINSHKNISREIITVATNTKNIADNKVNNDKKLNEKNRIDNSKINGNIKSDDSICLKNIENFGDKFKNSNINDILDVRINNAFYGADKKILDNDISLFKKLNDYTFDQKIGYLVCTLLDGNIRVSSKDYIVLSYEYDSIVEENIVH